MKRNWITNLLDPMKPLRDNQEAKKRVRIKMRIVAKQNRKIVDNNSKMK